ncbi:SDR family oxidoreductase [Microbacterium sp. 179-I 3D4 NHS]|uniref:SDR family oxidoreductase n=1 Tax=Microbacterium sp. 179-I 3D4 NHS TaxID=3142381 RepID=UPI0039A0BDBE
MSLISRQGGAAGRPGHRRRLRPLDAQVAVVTGASRGIGREVAVRLAARGARVVALARDEVGLAETLRRIEEAGGTARSLVVDVTDADAMRTAVAQVEEWFGRIDTWVGNAGVLLYASFEATRPEEFRDVLEVNVLGQIHGIQAALPALRRAGGGALIVVSSVEAAVALPLHSAYAASKHALEGALDGLRRELGDDHARISITSVRPAVIDTPIYRHARNRMPWVPKAPPPYYASAVVADAVEFAATHPVRIIHAGGGGRMLVALQRIAPGAVDAVLRRLGPGIMHTDEPDHSGGGDLRNTRGDDGVDGGLPRPGRRVSVYTWLATHPRSRRSLQAASMFATAALLRRHR